MDRAIPGQRQSADRDTQPSQTDTLPRQANTDEQAEVAFSSTVLSTDPGGQAVRASYGPMSAIEEVAGAVAPPPGDGPIFRSVGAGGGQEGGEGGFAAATRGPGGEVPYRKDMEQAFGQDFSSVQAYLGQQSALEGIGAQAAAQGDRVAFGSSSPSRELVAHELAHVVQTRLTGGFGAIQGKGGLSSPDDAAEIEADAVAPRAAAGERVQVSAKPSAGLHRKVGTLADLEGMASYNEIGTHLEKEARGIEVKAVLAHLEKEMDAIQARAEGLAVVLGLLKYDMRRNDFIATVLKVIPAFAALLRRQAEAAPPKLDNDHTNLVLSIVQLKNIEDAFDGLPNAGVDLAALNRLIGNYQKWFMKTVSAPAPHRPTAEALPLIQNVARLDALQAGLARLQGPARLTLETVAAPQKWDWLGDAKGLAIFLQNLDALRSHPNLVAPLLKAFCRAPGRALQKVLRTANREQINTLVRELMKLSPGDRAPLQELAIDLLQREGQQISLEASTFCTSLQIGVEVPLWTAKQEQDSRNPDVQTGLDTYFVKQKDFKKDHLKRIRDVMGALPKHHTERNNKLGIITREKNSEMSIGQSLGGGVSAAYRFEPGPDVGVVKMTYKTRGMNSTNQGGTLAEKNDTLRHVKNSFDHALRHEIGHSVDEKLNIRGTHGASEAGASWIYYDHDASKVADDVLPIAETKTQLAGILGGKLKTMDKAPVSDGDIKALLRKIVAECLKQRSLDKLKAEAAKDPLWARLDAPSKQALGNALGADTTMKKLQLGFSSPWEKDSVADMVIEGRVYQESAVGKEGQAGRWASYAAAARARKVSKYQFRSPHEWAAEAYAAFYEPVDGKELGIKLKTADEGTFTFYRDKIHQEAPVDAQPAAAAQAAALPAAALPAAAQAAAPAPAAAQADRARVLDEKEPAAPRTAVLDEKGAALPAPELDDEEDDEKPPLRLEDLGGLGEARQPMGPPAKL